MNNKYQTKQRETNMEILRIIATFFILFIHSNFWSLGKPGVEDIAAMPTDAFLRCLFEAFGIIAVNCFIFISAWFGMTLKTKGLLGFGYQCLFYHVVGGAIMILLGFASITKETIKAAFFIDNWYIQAYLILLIISPALNAFTEIVDKTKFKFVLISYFVFIFTYGTISTQISAFNGGYSALFFIGYYLLVRYIRLYKPKFSTLNKRWDIIIYLFSTLLITLIYYYTQYNSYTYIFSLVIVSSIHFSLIFTKFTFSNKTINWIAASSFAAYLLHGTPGVVDWFKGVFPFLHERLSLYMYWPATVGVLLLIMIIACLIDQLRKYSFEKLVLVNKHFNK